MTEPTGSTTTTTDPRVGLTVTHRRYVPYSHAHYAGNLVDGAYSLGLFGDVATEVCIRTDGDEGLFASYADVQFRAGLAYELLGQRDAALVAINSARRLGYPAKFIDAEPDLVDLRRDARYRPD